MMSNDAPGHTSTDSSLHVPIRPPTLAHSTIAMRQANRPSRLKLFLFRTREFLYQLLLVDFIRMCVAFLRFFTFAVVLRRLKTFDPGTGDIGVNAVHHNKVQLLKNISNLAVNRAKFLIYPLSAIRLSRSTPVLCIGPRAEGELLNLKGLGFRKIRGLDLISYSPWVDIGDMHNMPYADNSYGIAIMGWCLAYSDNRKKAASEVVRVLHAGGIVAVGSEFVTASTEEVSKRVGYQVCDEERLSSVADILSLFGDHVDYVYFSQDRPKTPCDKCELLAIFSIKK